MPQGGMQQLQRLETGAGENVGQLDRSQKWAILRAVVDLPHEGEMRIEGPLDTKFMSALQRLGDDAFVRWSEGAYWVTYAGPAVSQLG